MNRKLILLAAPVGAAVGLLTACSTSQHASSGGLAQAPSTAPASTDRASVTAWGLRALPHLQKAEEDAATGNLSAAASEWDAIPTPAVDPADWQAATAALNATPIDAAQFNTSADAWSAAFNAWSGQ